MADAQRCSSCGATQGEAHDPNCATGYGGEAPPVEHKCPMCGGNGGNSPDISDGPCGLCDGTGRAESTDGVAPSQGQSPLALIIQRLEAGCDPLWAARKLREYAAGVDSSRQSHGENRG